MKSRVFLPVLAVVYLVGFALVGSTQPPPGTELREGDLFDPVFAIMSRSPDQMGCVGCHIGPQPAIGPWFGADKETVLMTLETGINPEGQQLSQIPVEGGRSGLIAYFLHEGIMPLVGEDWQKEQLKILDKWLIQYE